MKTTHELAAELLALPDIAILVEGWCRQEGCEVKAVLTEYDPANFAILVQAPTGGDE